MILAFCVSGCVSATPGSLEAMCGATQAARADHAAALAETNDDNALRTGAVFIAKVDAACAS